MILPLRRNGSGTQWSAVELNRLRTLVTSRRGSNHVYRSKRTVHAAKNVGNDNAAELATYIVEKGKPLVTLVK